MKRTIAICALLATSCALAQGIQRPQGLLGRRLNSPLLRPPAQVPQEVYEKVPEEHRASVTSAIAKKAYDAATAEVSEKFGVIVPPGRWKSSWGWANDCGRGVIVGGLSTCMKFSADGRLLQTGTRDTFEELKWRDSRSDELIAAYWNDLAIVAEAVSNSVAEVKQKPKASIARKSGLLGGGRRGLSRLEELIPLEEALSLAKDGDGKGKGDRKSVV